MMLLNQLSNLKLLTPASEAPSLSSLIPTGSAQSSGFDAVLKKEIAPSAPVQQKRQDDRGRPVKQKIEPPERQKLPAARDVADTLPKRADHKPRASQSEQCSTDLDDCSSKYERSSEVDDEPRKDDSTELVKSISLSLDEEKVSLDAESERKDLEDDCVDPTLLSCQLIADDIPELESQISDDLNREADGDESLVIPMQAPTHSDVDESEVDLSSEDEGEESPFARVKISEVPLDLLDEIAGSKQLEPVVNIVASLKDIQEQSLKIEREDAPKQVIKQATLQTDEAKGLWFGHSSQSQSAPQENKLQTVDGLTRVESEGISLQRSMGNTEGREQGQETADHRFTQQGPTVTWEQEMMAKGNPKPSELSEVQSKSIVELMQAQLKGVGSVLERVDQGQIPRQGFQEMGARGIGETLSQQIHAMSQGDVRQVSELAGQLRADRPLPNLDLLQQMRLNQSLDHNTEQLAQRLRLMLNQKIQQAQIQLEPANLGKIRIHLQMGHEHAQLQISAQNSQTRDLIEQSLPRLKEMLAQAGVSLGQTQVEQQSKQQHFSQNTSDGADHWVESEEMEGDEPQKDQSLYEWSIEERIDFYA